MWRDALENERETGAHIESPTLDHHVLMRLRAVRARQLLGSFRRGSEVGELIRRKIACRTHTFGRGQHLLGGHVDRVCALPTGNDFVGKDALKLELPLEWKQGGPGKVSVTQPHTYAVALPDRVLNR